MRSRQPEWFALAQKSLNALAPLLGTSDLGNTPNRIGNELIINGFASNITDQSLRLIQRMRAAG
jgi:hypothetical protein